MPRSAAARSYRHAAPLFAALGDETRLRIVARLSVEGPLSITRLTAGTALTRQAVTKHLRVLAGAGFVMSGREGRESVWTLEPRSLAEARRWLDGISLEWDDRLERLRKHVES